MFLPLNSMSCTGPRLAQAPTTVPRFSFVIALGLSLGLAPWGTTPALAQASSSASSATAATAQPASGDDDDATIRPLEPDFTVVNLPTTLPLPRFKGNFHLTHRFNENLRRAPFDEQLSNLFGMDQGATIQFEYRFGVMKHLEAIAARTNNGKTFQFSGKYDALHESASSPIGLSGMVSVEGEDNFQRDYAPALGLVVSRTLGKFAAVYASPFWVHNTLSGTGITRDTGFVGIGTRLRIRPTVYIAGEVSPRIGGFEPGDANYAFAIEKRVGAHVFSLTFANSAATTFAQLARGGIPENLQFGFNLARKFF
jgi:uncharacterized beta barrel domain-containing protein DUF5777